MRSIPKSAARARPRFRSALARIALCALALGLAACADEPTTPRAGGEEQEEGDHTPPRTLGLVEITISGLGTNHVTSSALSAPGIEVLERLRAQRAAGGAAPGGLVPQDFTLPDGSTGGGDGTIQLELLSTGSFTDGVRGSGGYRYLYATYRVRNAQSDGTAYNTERQNLTFYAVDTDGTLGQTAISSLSLFNGSAADASLASAFVPTGAASQDARGGVVSRFPDVLQVLTETEAGELLTLANTAGTTVTDVFPYGFVVQNPNTPASRTLRASPAADQFDGVVTFAFKVPLQANPAEDPFTVSAVFLAVDDDEIKLSQSVEEQTADALAAFDARAAALGPNVVTLLPPAGYAGDAPGTARVLCDVRVAGAAGAATTTIFPSAGTSPWLVPSSLRAGSFMPSDARLAAASCSNIASASATSFAVHGFQSGRASGTYGGAGTSYVRAPAQPGGAFFPGEEVEVTLTTALGGTTPVVARYRVAASGGSGTFETDSTYAVGNDPWSVALGDVDGDGDLDMATANSNSNTVSVLLNLGGGSFVTDTTYAAGLYPSSVALGDVDGDGDLDMVTANSSSNNVSVLLNQGGGRFGTRNDYSVGWGPWSLALGDVDGDGDLDLVTANANSDDVSVLLNQGGGTFVAGSTQGVGVGPFSVALGDVDGDGDLDLATANSGTNDVSLLLNQGGGSFGTDTRYGVGTSPVSVALGDVDGDGDLDLATANSWFGDVSVLLNEGDGTFGASTSYDAGDLPNPQSVAMGDVDGDGDLDLATANYDSNSVSLLINQGDGSFVAGSTPGAESGQTSVAMGDVDGDGDLDLAVSNDYSDSVSVLRNR